MNKEKFDKILQVNSKLEVKIILILQYAGSEWLKWLHDFNFL